MIDCTQKSKQKKHFLIFNLVDENQFLLRLLLNVLLLDNSKQRNSLNFKVKSINIFWQENIECFVFVGQFNDKEILWFSKWYQSTYFKLRSVSKAYLLGDIVQKRRRVSIILDYSESSSFRNSISERFKAFLKVDSI